MSDLILCYSITNRLVNTSLVDSFKFSSFSRTRGHVRKLNARLCRKDITKFYFCNRVVSFWNKLPSHVVLANNCKTFKKYLNKLDNKFYNI